MPADKSQLCFMSAHVKNHWIEEFNSLIFIIVSTYFRKFEMMDHLDYLDSEDFLASIRGVVAAYKLVVIAFGWVSSFILYSLVCEEFPWSVLTQLIRRVATNKCKMLEYIIGGCLRSLFAYCSFNYFIAEALDEFESMLTAVYSQDKLPKNFSEFWLFRKQNSTDGNHKW